MSDFIELDIFDTPGEPPSKELVEFVRACSEHEYAIFGIHVTHPGSASNQVSVMWPAHLKNDIVAITRHPNGFCLHTEVPDMNSSGNYLMTAGCWVHERVARFTGVYVEIPVGDILHKPNPTKSRN